MVLFPNETFEKDKRLKVAYLRKNGKYWEKLENLDTYRIESWGYFNEENKKGKCWAEQSCKSKILLFLWQNIKIHSAHQIREQLKLKLGVKQNF